MTFIFHFNISDLTFCRTLHVFGHLWLSDTYGSIKMTIINTDVVITGTAPFADIRVRLSCIHCISMWSFQKGTMRGTRLAIDYLSKDNGGNGGVIINMASAAGKIYFTSNFPVY